MPGVVDQAWHCPEQAQRWSACLVDCCFWFFHRVLTLPPSDGQFTVHYLLPPYRADYDRAVQLSCSQHWSPAGTGHGGAQLIMIFGMRRSEGYYFPWPRAL